MLAYTLRRLAGSVPTLLILATLTFFLMRWAPGGPFDTDRVWPREIQQNIARKYELDKPVGTQFAHWLRDVLRGDFRESFQYEDRSVREIIGASLPISLQLGATALLISSVTGIGLGCLAAWKKNTWIDQGILFFSVIGLSLPSFLLATLLILIFSLRLGWLPPALWEGPSSAILPILTLSSRPLGVITRLTRISMVESLASDYIRTAIAKGLSSKAVLLKHALKNSLIPVLSVVGPLAANLITGSFLVETIFQIPGLGKHFVQAVMNRDYPLVMGVTLVYGVILILSNLVVDILYGWIDPRIRLD